MTGWGPSQYPVASQPQPIWSGVPNSPPILVGNQDINNTVYLGYVSDLSIGATNAAVLPPLTSLVMDGQRTIYAVAPDGTQPLQVIPGGTQLSASPVAVAFAIIQSGLAVAIANAIAGTGLSLIGNPQLLYSVSAVPPTTGAGLMGFTIPTQAITQSGCYDAGKTQAAADTQMVGILNRGNNGHPTFTKKFWNTISDFSLPQNDMQNYATFGTKVACALKPVFYTGLPANTNFKTATQLTAAQRAQAVTDFNNLTTFFNTLLGYGFTTALLTCVFYQEPEVGKNNMTPTDYQNVWFTYSSAIPAGIGLVPDIGSGAGTATAQSYANAAIASGITFAALAQDFYMPTWLRGNTTLDAIASIADAQVPKLPYGIYEFGCAPNNFGTAGQSDATGFLQYILTYMQARLQANKINADCAYYMGQCDAKGTGDLTSPIGLDPSIAAPDYRIPLYQSLFDTLTSVPTTPFTIPPATTKTITPVNPSPVGGLAPANFLSYEIVIGLSAGAASTNPFAEIIIQWFDFDQVAKNQQPVDQIHWFVPMGTNADPNGPLIIYGSGRMRGGFMVVKINNQDTVTCTVAFLQIAGTSRPGKRDEWLWNTSSASSPNVPGFTLAKAANASLQLGQQPMVNVAAGGTADYLCGLFAGDVYIRIYQTGAAANGTVVFNLQPEPVGVFGTQNLFNETVGANQQEQILRVTLPRCACKMHIHNTDVNPVTVDFQVIGVETS